MIKKWLKYDASEVEKHYLRAVGGTGKVATTKPMDWENTQRS